MQKIILLIPIAKFLSLCIENEVKKVYCFTVAGSHHTKWKAGAGGEKDRVIEDGGRSKDPAGQDGGITAGGTVVLWFF